MAWGTIQIGALTLKETDVLEDVTNANTQERTVRFEGRETNPGITQEALEAKQQDIMGMIDRVFPVMFERKSSYDGFYRVMDTNTQLEKWSEGPGQVRWSLSLQFIGADNSVEVESRMSGPMRGGQPGERWHAPAIGHRTYFLGATFPIGLFRTSSDGNIFIYRDIPSGINPTWSCLLDGYLDGRSRVLVAGMERTSTYFPATVSDWEMNNGLVRVRPGSTGSLLVAFYDGIWRESSWDVRIDNNPLVPADHFVRFTVVRNDPECVSVRIAGIRPLNGDLVLLDLVLRRGARFVEGYVQRATSGTLAACLSVAALTPWNDLGRYATAVSNDANGNLPTAGSSMEVSAAANGGVSASSTTTLDFYIGLVVDGEASAPDGDKAADLWAQYIGSMAEKVGIVRR